MAKIIVKCKICNLDFDRNSIPCTKVGNRYIHNTCLTESMKKELKDSEDLKELENYILIKFNQNNLSAKIKKQIRDFRKEYQYSYHGMLLTLQWWFDIKQNPIDDKACGGIGILPFVYEDAKDYYKKIWLIEQANKMYNENGYKREIEEININSPRVSIPAQKLFDIK